MTRRPAGGFWLRGAPDPQAGDGDPGDPEEDPEESALPFGEAADEAEAPREWPGWQVDQATASLAAGRLADAAGKAIPDGLAAAWLAHLGRPVEAEQPPPPPAAAGAWAATQAVTFQAAVEAVVPDLLAEGYFIGARAAVAMVFQADVDWDDWTPGDPDTARKILGDDGLGSGLRAMLADSQIRLAGIAEDRFAEFAQLLAKAAAEGWSVDHLAGELHNFGSDPVWARRTATTELARAISEATLDQYEELDVERHEWMVAGEDPQGRVKVCPICAANAAAGPVPVGDRFPSGEVSPPGHFSCRCCLAPAIDLDGYGDTLEETTPGWVWDVEEARYVRTAAGAKKYGLPIGSEIRPRRNRDGWHDDDQRAKRQAYYARARKRAQDRYAARQGNATADGYVPRKGDWLLVNGAALRVRTAPQGGKVDVGWEREHLRDVKAFKKGKATKARPLPVDLNPAEARVVKAWFSGHEDGGSIDGDGVLQVTDIPRAVARIDEAREGELTAAQDRTALSLQARLARMVDDPDAGKRKPKPDPVKPGPAPKPKPGRTGRGPRATPIPPRDHPFYGATATVTRKGSSYAYTVTMPDGTVQTRTSKNQYGAIRILDGFDGKGYVSFHRTPELANRPHPDFPSQKWLVVNIGDSQDVGDKGKGDATTAPAKPPAPPAVDEARVVERADALEAVYRQHGGVGPNADPAAFREALRTMYPDATQADRDELARSLDRSVGRRFTIGDAKLPTARGTLLAVRAMERKQAARDADLASVVESGRREIGTVNLGTFRMASDGGPDEDSLRRLEALRSTGAAVSAEVDRRMGGEADRLRGEDVKLRAEIKANRDEQYRLEQALGEEWFAATSTRRIPARLQMMFLAPEVGDLDEDAIRAANVPPHQVRAALAVARSMAPRVKANLERGESLRARLAEVTKQRLQWTNQRAQVRRDVLAEIRPMGVPEGERYFEYTRGVTKAKQERLSAMLDTAARTYPADWFQGSRYIRSGGLPVKQTSGRAHYMPGKHYVDVGSYQDDGHQQGVVTHEVAHAMEDGNKHLMLAQHAYLKQRTTTGGEPGSRTFDKVAAIYPPKKTEMGYRDDFPEHYTGKQYTDSPQYHHEILSTGVESLFSRAKGEYADMDMEHFLLGMLALL